MSQKIFKFLTKRITILLINIITISSSTLSAAPITFNTALPVAKGALVNREQFIFRQFENDNSLLDRDKESSGLVSVIGYGVTPKFALFGALPYFNKSLSVDSINGRVKRSNNGFGDPKIFGRYTFFQQDQPGQTFRLASFGGLKAPTAQSNKTDRLGLLPPSLQPSSGSWDYFGGLVLTYQTVDFQFDAQIQSEQKGRNNGFEFGRQLNFDLSYQHRVFPQLVGAGTRSFLYAVIESNWVVQESNRFFGIEDINTGGSTLYITPGVQYVTFKYILEAAVQIPVAQNLNGGALETDYIFTTGFRINF